MAVRMSQPTPQVADDSTLDEKTSAPRVRILLTAVADADLDAALAVVGRQVYEPQPEVVVVGADLDIDAGVETAADLEEAIASSEASFDYLWLLHADARPRPDALAALVSEIERNEASLAGSKLLKAGTMDELESVGGATDVFGEPYSGLDEGEIDLQQYDVVREVAFVQSASMLVRRDLAQGLRGLDPLLPPVAAGLDFSQRTRLAGGRVISVPSSEVYHQARCGARGRGWREQAGRLRAMTIAYSPLTLLWVVPYDFLVSIVDSIVSLLLLRWRPLVRHLYSWAWNIFHLPSTLRQRRRLRAVRSEGDEELFRFHAKGSLRLRAIGEEITGRTLSMFDDDQALARGSRRLWGSPGVWGAVVAALIALVSARAIIFGGMPNSGFSFPFEAPSIALDRWLAGWNEAGLGSPSPVHPSVGVTGLVSFLWFGAEGAARTLLTVSVSLLGILGVGRLAGRIGLRGPGRYLAGLVLIAGPGTAALVGRGSWLALAAAAVLPWAVRAAFVHPHEFGRSRLSHVGWALLTGSVLAALSPVLVLTPLLVVLVWRVLGGDRGGTLLALVTAVGGVAAAAFVAADPTWIYDSTRSLGASFGVWWPALILVGAVPLLLADGRIRTVGLTGGVVSLVALAIGRSVALGPGLEEAVLITASLGAAMVVAAALDSLSRNILRMVATAGAIAILLVSIGSSGNGRIGLPGENVNERLGFSVTLADDHNPGRVLYASVDRGEIPGESRPGPGFWYRVLDGQGTTHDEVWLPPGRDGDARLAAALGDIASGGELRPGEALAPFAIEWVVLEGPIFVLDDALTAQLDLVPTPLDPGSRVYENREAVPLAGGDSIAWSRSGTGFAGARTSSDMRIAANYADGWQRGGTRDRWAVAVDGTPGRAWYSPANSEFVLPGAAMVVLIGALVMIVWGRSRT
ncbi:MAG TPA: glycosyltransferase [Acidimicrobiia bacterium]|nr:glycosyltransferase [Acidimicrobiia bacterium]